MEKVRSPCTRGGTSHIESPRDDDAGAINSYLLKCSGSVDVNGAAPRDSTLKHGGVPRRRLEIAAKGMERRTIAGGNRGSCKQRDGHGRNIGIFSQALVSRVINQRRTGLRDIGPIFLLIGH